MEILAKCGAGIALSMFDLDYNEIRSIIDFQSKLKEILSDNPKFTLSYKISGKVCRYILDKKFLSNLFGDSSIMFISEDCIPINKTIERIKFTDLSLIVDPYGLKVGFESSMPNAEVFEASYKSSLESFSKILGGFCEIKTK